MGTLVTNPKLKFNGDSLKVASNTVDFDEGLGEQTYEAENFGDVVEGVFSDDLSTHIPAFKISVYATVENIEKLRKIKERGNNNVAELTGRTQDGSFGRTFLQAAITNNYKVALKAGESFEIEVMASSITR